MTPDRNIEIARIQKEIEEYIGLGERSVVFDYRDDNSTVNLHVITINPQHNQSFLFHHTQGINKVDALEKMLDYVKNYKQKESSYTIQWSTRDEEILHTSYFSAKNVMGALDKLFYERDPNSIVIFSVNLNPIT